jgi:hypothetical protein
VRSISRSSWPRSLGPRRESRNGACRTMVARWSEARHGRGR